MEEGRRGREEREADKLELLTHKIEEFTNPLLWWKTHAARFPQLAKLARRVLCTPATSAPSERIFSVPGLIATKIRNRLASENVALLVFAWRVATGWGLAQVAPRAAH